MAKICPPGFICIENMTIIFLILVLILAVVVYYYIINKEPTTNKEVVVIKENNNIQQAFLNFQSVRKIRVDRIVKQSSQIGKMAHVSIGQGLRNWLMRRTPTSITQKQLDFLYTI